MCGPKIAFTNKIPKKYIAQIGPKTNYEKNTTVITHPFGDLVPTRAVTELCYGDCVAHGMSTSETLWADQLGYLCAARCSCASTQAAGWMASQHIEGKWVIICWVSSCVAGWLTGCLQESVWILVIHYKLSVFTFGFHISYIKAHIPKRVAHMMFL